MRNLRLTTGVLAIACAAAVGCAQATQTDQNDQTNTTQTGDHGSSDTAKTVSLFDLRDAQRKLWSDHVAYTRFYIIEAIADLPGAKVTAARLLENQDEIGNSFKPFYGDAAGDKLSSLLRQHILGAVDVLVAAKAGDRAALQTASNAWYANADDIAKFLSQANPAWDFDAVREMMHEHLDQTIAEATARLTGDWDGDVRAFDAIVTHILDMADTFANGIATQFPDRVDTTAVAGADVHVALRKLWEDHVIWTRNVIISIIANGCAATLADLPTDLMRLLRNQIDIGNAARPFVGDAGADRLTALLHDHITVAGEIVVAAKAGDTAAVSDAAARWYANANDIADLLAGALGLDDADAREMMKTHLDQTLDEATHYLKGDFKQSVNDYDHIVDHILMMSDAISDAL